MKVIDPAGICPLVGWEQKPNGHLLVWREPGGWVIARLLIRGVIRYEAQGLPCWHLAQAAIEQVLRGFSSTFPASHDCWERDTPESGR